MGCQIPHAWPPHAPLIGAMAEVWRPALPIPRIKSTSLCLSHPAVTNQVCSGWHPHHGSSTEGQRCPVLPPLLPLSLQSLPTSHFVVITMASCLSPFAVMDHSDVVSDQLIIKRDHHVERHIERRFGGWHSHHIEGLTERQSAAWDRCDVINAHVVLGGHHIQGHIHATLRGSQRGTWYPGPERHGQYACVTLRG
eukprot:1156508-Pelagomonas_calceolata.AAC.5